MDDHHFPYFSIHIAYYCHISAIQWLGGIGYLFSIFSIHIAYYCHISAIQWLGGIRYLFSLKKSPAQWFNWGKKAGTSRVFLGAWYILWYTICHYVSDLGGWSSILSNPFIRIYTALKKKDSHDWMTIKASIPWKIPMWLDHGTHTYIQYIYI